MIWIIYVIWVIFSLYCVIEVENSKPYLSGLLWLWFISLLIMFYLPLYLK